MTRIGSRRSVIVGVAGAVALASTAAAGNDPGVAETETEFIQAGFLPDPLMTDVVAGGSDRADTLITGCVGWISLDAPSYRMTYWAAPSFPLGFYVRSAADATLAVRTPSGDHLCSDDFSEESGSAPGVWLDAPESGDYEVWVGTWRQSDAGAPARLAVTEKEASGSLGGTAARTADSVLSGGFGPGPHTVEVTAGGRRPAFLLDPDCSGYVRSETADFSFEHYPAGPSLGLLLLSETDTVLAVRSPSGEWACSDDFSDAGGGAPGLDLREPEPGTYEVWLGTFAPSGASVPATLMLVDRRIAASDFHWRGAATASGFLVSAAGHVLTGRDGVAGCPALTVEPPGGGEIEAVLVAENAAAGLALLKVEAAEAQPHAVIRGHPPLRLGEEVAVPGFPAARGQGVHLSTGVVSALSGHGGNLQELRHTADVHGGLVGAPILDRGGLVVGIVGAPLGGTGSVPPAIGSPGIRGSVAEAFLAMNGVFHRAPPSSGGAAASDTAELFSVAVHCRR